MFLDTANLSMVKSFNHFDWVRGVTTNPTLLRQEQGQNRKEVLQKVYSEISPKLLFVQVQGESVSEMRADAEQWLEIGNGKIGLKIQADEKGLVVIQQVKKDYPESIILATVIFSLEQAYLAGLSGCDWIAPYVNRMENQGLDPFDMVQKIRRLYDTHGITTRIMGASFKNHAQIMCCLLAGADEVTVPPELLQTMMENKLAQNSIEQFNRHAKEGESGNE